MPAVYTSVPQDSIDSIEFPVQTRNNSYKQSKWTRTWKHLLASLLLISVVSLTARDFFYRRHLHPYSPHHGHLPHGAHASDKHRNPAYLIEAKHGAVASENVRCSNIGVQVMKDGGNAVDAMVAAIFCTGVVNMFSSGIGGGGFMTVRIPSSTPNGTSEVWTVDFRETAPSGAHKDMYTDDPDKARWGGLAVAVPGEVKGLEEAHKRWGKLPWERLVRPSVELAAGWEVDVELGRRLELDLFQDYILSNPDWSSIFAPDGEILTEGSTIRRTALSHTLSSIATNGSSAFYTGPIAAAMIEKIQATGGILTLEDLAGYEVKVRRALEGSYRGRKIYVPHAPTSGGVLLHMFNLVESYKEENWMEEGRTGLNVHRMLEAMKFGFAARTKVGDPAFMEDTQRIDEIPTKEFSARIFANMTDEYTHPPEYYQPEYDVPLNPGTSHTSVVDKDGMAVALTTTVNLIFGSLVMDPVTGVLFNDEMDDFSIPGHPNAFGLWPSPYNYPEPGKRSLSSTTPMILEYPDGSFYTAIGGSGGSKIFPAVFQVLLNMDWGDDVSAAIEQGRVHDQLFPLSVEVDDVIDPVVVEELRGRGHNVTLMDINRVSSVIQAVMKTEDGRIFAASDSRKNGIAAGY